MPRKRPSDQHPMTVQAIVQSAYQLASPELDELIAALLALREALEPETLAEPEMADLPQPTAKHKGNHIV